MEMIQQLTDPNGSKRGEEGNSNESIVSDSSVPEKKAPIITEPIIVEKSDGQRIDIQGMGYEELSQLQWDQECAFAEQIKNSVKGSAERTKIIRTAYQTVCQILAQIAIYEGDADLSMGMDTRYQSLVLQRLENLHRSGIRGGFFEVGFGSGLLLEAVAKQGYEVGGLEVAEQLVVEAKKRLPERTHDKLCLGAFTENQQVESMAGQFSVVYWNDVFEHVPVDEIDEYLTTIYSLLSPGGQLITITPNWHMRPMDVTAANRPPRTEAVGFHLKEYRLGEVCHLLNKAGFHRVETPLFVGRKRIVTCPLHLTRMKRLFEPMLEWLPYSLAVQCCRRFGLTITMAEKPRH